MYIIKGRIREYVIYSNQKLLRRGSLHFLPKTEVILCHFYNYQFLVEKKMWIRGKHKSGLLKTRGIYFKFLADLRIEKVQNPSNKTLDFIKKNNILIFGENNFHSLQDAEKILSFFEENQAPEITLGKIEDDLFLKAQDYLLILQNLLKGGYFEIIIQHHIAFPIQIKERKKNRMKLVEKEEFLRMRASFFTKKVVSSILNTDIETIFPSIERMIIGSVEIKIENEEKFQISKIELE